MKTRYWIAVVLTAVLVGFQGWLAVLNESEISRWSGFPSIHCFLIWIGLNTQLLSILVAISIALLPFLPTYISSRHLKTQVRAALLKRFIDEHLDRKGRWFRITIHSEVKFPLSKWLSLKYRCRILFGRIQRPKRNAFDKRIGGTFVRKEVRDGTDFQNAVSKSYFFVPFGNSRTAEGLAARAMKGINEEVRNLPDIGDYLHKLSLDRANRVSSLEASVVSYMKRTHLTDRIQLERLSRFPKYIYAVGLPDLDSEFRGAIVYETDTTADGLNENQKENMKQFALSLGASYSEVDHA